MTDMVVGKIRQRGNDGSYVVTVPKEAVRNGEFEAGKYVKLRLVEWEVDDE